LVKVYKVGFCLKGMIKRDKVEVYKPTRGNQDEEEVLRVLRYDTEGWGDLRQLMVKTAKIWHRYKVESSKLGKDNVGGQRELSERFAKKYGLDLEKLGGNPFHDGWKSSPINSSDEVWMIYEAMGQIPRETTYGNSGLSSLFSSVIAIAGILGGIFFLSSNITGNTIANVSQSSGNILGAGLLIVGLIAGFFWIKDKKK